MSSVPEAFLELDQLDISERLTRLSAMQGDKVAVHAGSESLTFRQLDDNVSRVAYALTECIEQSKQHPVAILLDSGIATISSIYGVLRAGHFYCAIPPSERPEQIIRVLHDLGEPVVITERNNLEQLGEDNISGCKILLYSDIPWLAQADHTWPILKPDALMGVFYTSGSTGNPKGILRVHRELRYLNRIYRDHVGFRSEDHILAMRPFSASASLVDIFGGIMNGATLTAYDIRKGGIHDLVSILRTGGITVFRPPVQVMRSVTDLLSDDEYFPDIRLFLATGDVLYKKDVEKVRRIIPQDATIIHQLASSEAGLVAVNKITHDVSLPDGIVSAGHPLPDQEILVLDEDEAIITDGRVGEICIAGDYTFTGYWNHPELVNDVYLPDPRDDKKRIMRTGDLGRFRSDGQLELHGRKDFRVKVRGFSINLAAIENTLILHPNVQRAVVIAATDTQGQKRLVAYILPSGDEQPIQKELVELLSSHLPGYMIPSLFMYVADLPIGRTGKADRKRLPSPVWGEYHETFSSYAPPQDEIEERLVSVWKKTLKARRVGIDDGFFELGGDSLLAMHLLMNVEKEFSRRVPFAVISQASTIREQADILRSEKLAEYSSILLPVQTYGHKAPLYCIGGRGGLPIRFNRLLRYMDSDQPVYFFRSHGFSPGETLRYTKEDVAADYIRELKKIQPKGPYHFVGESGGGLVAYEMAQQLRMMGDEVGLVGLVDTVIVNKARTENYQGNPWLILRKHIQILSTGGFEGVKAYFKYYMDVLAYWGYQFQNWIIEGRSRSRYGALPKVFDQISDANATASRVYKVKPYPGSVVLFHAARQARMEGYPSDNGWADIELGELIIHSLDCYHGNILFEPFIKKVAEHIKQYLH